MSFAIRLLGVLIAGLFTVVCAESPETLGDRLRGELTSYSPVNQNDGSRYYLHLLCAGDAGDDGKVALYRFDGPFKARLSIQAAETGLLGTSKRLSDAGLVLIQLPDNDCLTLTVSGSNESAYGPYRLEPVATQPLTMDDQMELNADYLATLDSNRAYRFALPVAEDTELDLTLFDTSRSFIAFIWDGEQRDLADAVACEGTELQLHAYLAAGDYQLVLLPNERPNPMRATGDCAPFSSNPGQAVYLSSATSPWPANTRNSGELQDGERVNGVLGQGQHNTYQLRLKKPASVQVDLQSSDFDAYLLLEGEEVSLRDDDGGDSSNARINAVLPAGDYRVTARDFGALYRGGPYQLRLETQPIEQAEVETAEVRPGDQIDGRLNATSHQHLLILEQTTTVTVDLAAEEFDAALRLSGNGVNLSDADSGLGSDARIQVELAPGSYRLDVSAADRGNGRYTLSVADSANAIDIQNEGIVSPGDRLFGEVEHGRPLQYWLVVDDPVSVRIRASSHTLDTVLRLSGRGLALENDDHGGSSNSLIEVDLLPGTYTLDVSEWGSDHNSGVIFVEIMED